MLSNLHENTSEILFYLSEFSPAYESNQTMSFTVSNYTRLLVVSLYSGNFND
jgi:hypothetical protein